MNKILLIKTKGCESCEIVEHNIKEIIDSNKKYNCVLEVIDKNNCNKVFLKQNKITDFPTVIFYKDDTIKFKFVGNYPIIVIIQWIHNFFLT